MRTSIAKYYQDHYPNLKPEDNIAVVSGAQVGLCATIAAFVDQGDEVIIFEPFYACYNK